MERGLTPPIEPMLARARDTLPPAGMVPDAVWQQKLDGYRVIVFLRSGAIHLQSRRGADLTAAFPDIAAAASTIDEDLVLDGELVVLRGGRLDFEALQHRARYTGRRAADAARAMPAHVVAFDLLEADGEALLPRPYRERWARLKRAFDTNALPPPWTLVASTRDRSTAQAWLDPAWGHVGIEGVMVKGASEPYRPGQRGWWKVRSHETAEAVIAGVTGPVRAPVSLLLGRFDATGKLRLAARSTPLRAERRRELGAMLAPGGPGHPWAGQRFSVGWGSREDLEYETVDPDLIAEFQADAALDRGRYRHPVRFLRIRADLATADVPSFGQRAD